MKKLITIFILVLAIFLVTSSQATATASTAGTVYVHTPNDCHHLAYSPLKMFCASGNLEQCILYTQIYHDQCNNAFDFKPEVLANYEEAFQFGQPYAEETYNVIRNLINREKDSYTQNLWGYQSNPWEIFNDPDLPYPQTAEELASLQFFDGYNVINVTDIMGAEADFFEPIKNDKQHIVDPSETDFSDSLEIIPLIFECSGLSEACEDQLTCELNHAEENWYNGSCHSLLPIPTGQPCTNNSECVTNKCIPTSEGKLCSCATNSDCGQTAQSTFCVITNDLGMCIEQSSAGAEVTSAGQCVNGLYEQDTKKCFCEIGTNNGCQPDDLCQNKYLCVKNNAYNPAGGMAGASCAEGYECLSGLCEDNICKCSSTDHCQSAIAYCDSQGDKTCKDRKFAGQAAQQQYECLGPWSAGKCKCIAGGFEGCEGGSLCSTDGTTCAPDPSLIPDIFKPYDIKNKKTNKTKIYCCKKDPKTCVTPLKNNSTYDTKFTGCLTANACSEGEAACSANPNACETDTQCSAPQYCNLTAKYCIDKLGSGAYCTKSNVCLSGSCQTLHCTAPTASSSTPPGPGANCLASNGICQEKYFCNIAFPEYGLNVCVLLLGPDKKCSNNNQCISNVCQNEKCTAPSSDQILDMQSALGQSTEELTAADFGTNVLGQSCTKYTSNNNKIDCIQNHYCSDETSKCAYQLGTGGACLANYYCLSNNCDSLITQSCQPAVSAPDPNDPPPEPAIPSTCTAHTQCPSTMYCDIAGDKKCKDKHVGGTVCLTPGPDAMCISGECDVTDNICTCTTDAECPDENTCITTTGKCQPKAAVNGDCSATPCVSTAYCDATTKKCLALKASGGDCTSTEMCPKDHECKETDVSGVKKKICACKKSSCADGEFCSVISYACTTKLDEGKACVPGNTGDAVCKSGTCDKNTSKCTKPIEIAGGGDAEQLKTTDLPDFLNTGAGGPYAIVGRVVSYLIGISGSIAFLAFMYGGILWLVSAGREEYIKKGQQAMTWSVIGLAIIFSSYIIIKFIVSVIGGNI